MGAFLEKPKTEKNSRHGEGYGLKYGASAMQGWRMEMEDADACITEFKLKNWSFFGVFDGHAGSKVSQYCSTHLLDCILQYLAKKIGEKEEYSVDEMKKAMHGGFLDMDETLKKEPLWAKGEDHSGTTAIVVMISSTHIIWANCGDSRSIFCSDSKLVFATADHKPSNDHEKSRIEKAGGTVMMQRVNGTLAVSRALGDFDYKRDTRLPPIEQLVSPEPDMTVIKRNQDKDEFLVLACDGIYDVMSNDDVLNYVRHRLELTSNLESICNDLIDVCLHKNSRDNMSVVLVTFPGAPKVSVEAIQKEEELQKVAKDRIFHRLTEIVEGAHDPLEVEENYIVQQLTEEMPASYDVPGKRPLISEKLQELTKSKFSNLDSDFTGPSDPSVAPTEMNLFTNDGNEIVVKGVMSGGDDTDPEYDEPLLGISNTTEIEDSTGEKMIVATGDEEQMEITQSEEKPGEATVPTQTADQSNVAT